MVILGGTGTLAGPVIGTSILVYIAEILQDLQEWQIFAYGVLLAVVMFVMPRGIVGTVGELYARLTDEAARARNASLAQPRRAARRTSTARASSAGSSCSRPTG